MKYQYNFGFFDEWIKANPQIKKKALLDALGIKADSGMKKWADRRYPMPVISMLRFCNSFNVPLSAFFRDMDADEQPTTIPHPTINDQLEPDGGYIKPGEERQRGEHTILDPLAVEVTESNMPDGSDWRKTETSVLGTVATARDGGTGEAMRKANEKGVGTPHSQRLTNEQMDGQTHRHDIDANALLALETAHAAQRDRLLDIIAAQQKSIAAQQRTIAELTAQIAQIQEREPQYRVVKEYAPNVDALGMVAEGNDE